MSQDDPKIPPIAVPPKRSATSPVVKGITGKDERPNITTPRMKAGRLGASARTVKDTALAV